MADTGISPEATTVQVNEFEPGKWEASFADVFIGNISLLDSGGYMAFSPEAGEQLNCASLRQACIWLVVNFYPFFGDSDVS